MQGTPPLPGRTLNGIEIEFTAGFGEAPEDVPANLREGMKEILTLQRPVLTPDGGGFETVWEDVAVVYARIEAFPAGEEARNRRLETGNGCRITLHYRAGVTRGMRLAGEAGVFGITAVHDPDGARATLEISAWRRT